MQQTLSAGETINLSFVWQDDSQRLKSYFMNNWTLTMQLFDSEGNFVAQSDGTLWWLPTSAWVPKQAFEDIRSFALPADLPAGDYEMRIGWYREENGAFIRMTVTQGESVDNLLILPSLLRIE
jgi:hypothetical protein